MKGNQKGTERLKALLAPIDWANPLASEVANPEKPKKEEQQ